MTGHLSQEEIDALLKGQVNTDLQEVEKEEDTGAPELEKGKTPLVEKVQFASLQPQQGLPEIGTDLHYFFNIPLSVSCELGTATITVRELLKFEEGSIVKLNKMAGDSSTLLVNEQYLGQAEVVIVNERFGMRVTTVGLEGEKGTSDIPETKDIEVSDHLQTEESTAAPGEENK